MLKIMNEGIYTVAAAVYSLGFSAGDLNINQPNMILLRYDELNHLRKTQYILNNFNFFFWSSKNISIGNFQCVLLYTV